MNNLRKLMKKNNISINDLSKDFSKSPYQTGQKTLDYKKLKFNEILILINLLNLSFEEIFLKESN